MYRKSKNNFTLGVLVIIISAISIVLVLAIIIGVIFVEQAERKIPIQYANKSTSVYSNQSFMPIKVNTAGVIPVIFASSLMQLPIIISSFVGGKGKGIGAEILNGLNSVGIELR